jgi:hypothetical protein
MSVLPDGKQERIEFCETHNPTWNTNAVAIGTTAASVASLVTLTTAARNAYNAQIVAMNAARDATNTANLAVDAMTKATADIIKQIRTKAAISGDSVYSLASIPAPAARRPTGPLGMPNNFRVELAANGVPTIFWECTNPRNATGVVYTVYRSVGGTNQFEYLGGVGGKKFSDDTLPAGSEQVQYQVQAVRSTGVGPFAQFNVNFGVSGPVVTETEVTRLAA